jgi:hypothetical protein
MDDCREELLRVLDEIIAILQWDKNAWQNWMQDARARLLVGDTSASEKILRAYGGMGSFNDLIVGQTYDAEGNHCWRDGYKEKNDRLDYLSTRAWQLAQQVKKQAE